MSHFMVRWLKLSLVVIVGCGFLAMMIYALINKDEIRSSQVEPPLIMAAAEPLKRRPDQPGGLQIPNRDKLVFDLLDSNNGVLGQTGVASSQPVSISEPIEELTVNEVSESVQVTTPTRLVTPTLKIEKPATVVSPAGSRVAAQAEMIKGGIKEVVKPEEAKALTSGKWGVQLAAVNSAADGNALALQAVKDFPVLASFTPRVIAVPKANKYRVQFIGAKDRVAAAAVCAKLAGKQACFPVAP